MMVTATRPKLEVKFFVWGTPGKGITFEHKNKLYKVGCLQDARAFAKSNGYSGIRIRCA